MRQWQQRGLVALGLIFVIAWEAQANPIQAPLDTIKSAQQKIAEVTQLLSELDGYLHEVLQHVAEATLSEEDTALEELRAAVRINTLFVRDLALAELELWMADLREELATLASTIRRLRSQGEFSAFGRVLTRSVAKAAALQALSWDIHDELADLAAKVDTSDPLAACIDELDDPVLTASISICLSEAIAAVWDGDFSGLDARADRIETIILERIEPEKDLIARKLNQMKTELKSLERELKRLARFKERREVKRTMPRSVALAAGVTVKDALDRILDLQQISTDLRVQLLDIDDQMDALLDLLAELKSDIDLGRPVMELRPLVEQALQLKDFTLLIELDRVQANLNALREEHAQLVEQVQMLCASGRIRRRGSCRRALQELTAMGQKLERVAPVLDSIKHKLDNGRPEDFPFCEMADPCDDVNDWLLDLQGELAGLPGASTELDGERWAGFVLNAAFLLQEAIAQKDCLLLGLTCAVESGLRPFRGLIRELNKELKLLQRLLGRELRALSVPARAGLQGSGALQALSSWKELVVYGLDGRPRLHLQPDDLASRTPLEALQAHSSMLPNGFYLVVVTTRAADGRPHKTVYKLSILR